MTGNDAPARPLDLAALDCAIELAALRAHYAPDPVRFRVAHAELETLKQQRAALLAPPRPLESP